MARAVNKRRFTENNIQDAHAGPGVYRLYEGRQMTYIGSSRDISQRLEEHSASQRFSATTSFDFLRTASVVEARKLERRQIQKRKPKRNHT